VERVPLSAYDFFGHVAPGVLLMVGLEWIIGYPRVAHQDLKPFTLAVVFLAVYVGGHIVAGPAKTVLEDVLVGRVLGRPWEHLLAEERRWYGQTIFRGYCAPLPPVIRARVKAQAVAAGVRGIGESLFLHVRYCEEVLKNDRLMAKLDTFVGLYGFCRNTAFAALVVVAGLLTKTYLGHGLPNDKTRAMLLVLAAVSLFYRYLKYLRQYCYELFNQFASSKEAC
jgi:hypothetical protein